MSGTAWGAEGGTPACGIGAPKAQASGAARAATVERLAQRMTDSAEALRPSCPLDCRAWPLFPASTFRTILLLAQCGHSLPVDSAESFASAICVRNPLGREPLWRATALGACSLGGLL